jgi:hypothetical protein
MNKKCDQTSGFKSANWKEHNRKLQEACILAAKEYHKRKQNGKTKYGLDHPSP